jgi:hypothetical protein
MLKMLGKKTKMMTFYKKRPSLYRLTAIFLLLGVCLVGSCKTADLPGSYGSGANSQQFRIALFPDQVIAPVDKNYIPAKGYINTAEDYIAENPDDLLMLTMAEAKILLGKPSVVRNENPAEIWQYQVKNCVIDLYFYQNDGGGTPSPIAYYEIRRMDYDAHLDDSYVLPRSKKIDCLSRVIANHIGFEYQVASS